MTQKNTFTTPSFDRTLFIRATAIGAGIALIAILFFVVGAESQSHWPEHWQIRPLIITPLAGGIGGALFYVATQQLQRAGLNRIAALILCAIGYFIALWLGIVLGLDGTMWD